VPSSTSSSRAPFGPWGSIWLLTLLLTATLVVGAEVGLRVIGFSPTLRDDPAVWALHRGYADGSKPLILLGDSRMQLDVDPMVLSEYLGRPVIQLAIDGSNPIPVLADLAHDEGFRGDIWVSLRAENLFGFPKGRSREYVAHFREVRGNLNTRWNTAAVAAIDSRFALRSVITKFPTTRLPVPSHISMRGDRYKAIDYTKLDVDAHRAGRIRITRDRYAYWTEHPPTIRMLEDSLAILDENIQAIQRRGGEVTLIRFPTGPALWATADSVFPREQFWDRLASQTSAKVLHYRDEPSLGAYTLPDESHLDFRDVPAFTRALVAAASSL
jgi:hypothetical protein